ncbi:hypothetical protein CVT26_007668 [Gymnopilus dilepis]|uniref:AB hydrolase-1 domain-containing protein n=1 Tax=Gymnopilus dilepis TaxID=231916 RepID=A0A409W893_9AGAR|nr:hypothetical protein CVT26_007668 [Gymnopilus dilepis]
MNSELFVLDCPPSPEAEYEYVNAPTSLKMAAKRYTKNGSELQTRGLTLLFAHCIGAHKEQWEPVIDKLFDLQHSKTVSHRIREAWSFDWQSHGDSAVLNREQLKEARPTLVVAAYEWAAAISAFVESPRMEGHRIVTLGHSGGVGALVHSARYLRQLRPYHAMIIIEPAFLPRDLFHLYQHQNLAAVNFVYSTTLSRRESWASRKEAFDYLRQRTPCSLWDERVLRLFVEHALEDSDNQDGRSVILKCCKQVEAKTYCDLEPALEAAVYLKSLCSRFPIHLIWGSIDDFVPGFAKEILSDPGQGWTFSSISKIDGSGHMVVQENPDRLALTIAGILDIPCLHELFVLECPPSLEAEYEYMNTSTSLDMAAKRYTKNSSEKQTQGLTLLFAHCIGAHKEQWEPVIDRLFDLQEPKKAPYRIREAWSFDWQSHGDSATLNRERLQRSRPYATSGYEWAAAIAGFIESPRLKDHRVVVVGHSAGAGAMVHSTRYLHQPCNYNAIILVEPSFVPRELFHFHQREQLASLQLVYSATAARRNSWNSRRDAFDYFRKRMPCSLWDERVLKLYVEHGLEDSVGQDGPCVVLKCDKFHEATSYCDAEPAFEAAVHVKGLSTSLPVHFIWGSKNDFVPEFVKRVISDPAEGRRFASITKIDGCGHMVVQENPDKLALTIAQLLDTTTPGAIVSRGSSKL